jgi:hypothetical protein
LHTTRLGDNGVTGAGERILNERGDQQLRREISLSLTLDVIELVG